MRITRVQGEPDVVMTAKEATGVGLEVSVRNWRHIGIEIVAHADAASGAPNGLVVKAQGSYQKHQDVAFGSAQSLTNRWDYVAMVDLQDSAKVDGDTGVTFSAADVRNYELSCNGLRTVNFNITARVAGALTITVYGVSQ
jgi:hypothetical protein